MAESKKGVLLYKLNEIFAIKKVFMFNDTSKFTGQLQKEVRFAM